MDNHARNKTLSYIIDNDFKIIFSNSALKYVVPKSKQNLCCFEIFGNEKCQCKKCPLRSENQGKSILFDHLRGEWISVSSAPIDIPGIGTCHVIINNSIENGNQGFMYEAVGKSDYAELLELNYLNDSFKVAYHSERKSASSPTDGRISTMVRRVAERSIHPEDRQRFLDFWLLDQLGAQALPKALHTIRHGEFRSRRPDGGYDWVQQVLMPIRQSSSHEIFVNNFYNIIDTPVSQLELPPEPDHSALYGKDDFFRRADEIMSHAGPGVEWSLIAIDVERLKLFNEWYGRPAGDQLLARITECLLDLQNGRDRIASHFYDDDYAFLLPHDELEIRELYRAISTQVKRSSDKMNILPAFGVYTVAGSCEPVYKMYDRAKLACASVKGNYTDRIKNFDSQMLDQLQSEYLLLSDIQKAFQNREFTFCLQPKCSTESGKIVGAEALARWYSEEKGMISPGVFVPFLEKSGFVSELDTYIWEEVCKWQRSMLDRGMPALPVSVNVSRIDMYAVDVAAYFQNLIHKYSLDPSLIEIEITESAYAEDTAAISQLVHKLRAIGFCVLMDDFGSAYSSLNMLKDIEVDVLKIDMRFLDLSDSNAQRGTNIVETICHMAHLLGMKIVAEGVETQEQRDLLLKAGCSLCQGFHFYRPLSIGDYEATVSIPENLGSMEVLFPQEEMFYLKDVMIHNAFSLNMLDNIIGALAFYDVCGDNISLLRFNEQYASLFGEKNAPADLQLRFGQQLFKEERKQIFQMFDDARKNITTGSEMDLRRRKQDGTEIWIHLRVFFLYTRNGHDIFYSTVRDVTDIHKSNEMLTFLNNEMPGGYYRHTNDRDGTFTHITQRFLDIFDYTRQEIRELFDDKFINMVHPDDRQAVWDSISALDQTGGIYSQPCRMRSKHGYIFVLDQSRLTRYQDQKVFQGIIFYNVDPHLWLNQSSSADDSNAITTLMPCGFFQSEADGGHHFGYISSSLLNMLGYSRTEFVKKFKNSTENLVYHEDRPRIDREVLEQIQHSHFIACEFRVEMADGSLKWVYSCCRMHTDQNGKRWCYTCITDYDYLKEKYQVAEWQYIKYKSLSAIPGLIVFDYAPATDCLTVELTLKNGVQKTVVAEEYIQNIEQHGIVSQECVPEQKAVLAHASLSPGHGVTEFRGRFLKNAPFRWYRFHFSCLADETGKVYRVVGRGDDITKEKKAVLRASKDSLTGLLNYEEIRERSIALLRQHRCGSLFMVDIDNFKSINDTLGHLSGDELLKNTANIIQATFRKKGIAARFGGDEFLIFVPGLTDQRRIVPLAQKLLKDVAKIPLVKGQHISCSIGITQVEDGCHEIPFEDLFQQADTALYQSKRNGKNRCTFYAEEMHDSIFLR